VRWLPGAVAAFSAAVSEPLPADRPRYVVSALNEHVLVEPGWPQVAAKLRLGSCPLIGVTPQFCMLPRQLRSL
jgi:hypothetical protein